MPRARKNSSKSAVPAPWTEITTKVAPEKVSVNVWGRTYAFDHSLLPTEVLTAGAQVLSAPIRLVGKQSGKPIRWDKQGTFLLSNDRAQAVVTGWASNNAFVVGTSTRVEFDGFMRTDLVITPSELNGTSVVEHTETLDELVLEIPLKSECATLFHYIPGGWGHANNSGPVSADGLKLPFKPLIWLGWEDGGLSWFAESDQGWQPADLNAAIEVKRNGKETLLRIHLLDSRATKFPLTFTFGFQATPLKPMVRNFHEWGMCHEIQYEMLNQTVGPKKEKVLDYLKRSGVKTVVFSEYWTPIQNFWETDREADLKKLVAECHKRGIKFLLYYGGQFSMLDPHWAEFADDVVVKNPPQEFRGTFYPYRNQRRYETVIQVSYCVCYHNARWQDKFVAGIMESLRKFNADGIYLDGTIQPFECANLNHGCGYHAPDGSVHVTYPVFSVRNMMKRLYEQIHPSGGIINAHTSTCCITPTLVFCDSYWDGEQFQGGELAGDPLKLLPLETFRAEFMGKNFGVPCDFLVYPRPNWTYEMALSFTLLHDVLVRPFIGIIKPKQGVTTESVDLMSRIWKAYADFGVSNSTWHPYWRNRDQVTAQPGDIKVSLYKNRGRVLLVVSNLSNEKVAGAQVRLNRKALGLPKAANSAYDGITGERQAMKADTISVALPPMHAKLIRVE